MGIYASNAGKSGGEYYTPQEVSELLNHLTIVRKTEVNKVYDPACGSCGFLAQSYLYMKKNERTIEDYRMLQEKTFFGQEKKPLPALLGLMNMVLHGVTAPRIVRRNTLEENIRSISERYEVVLTNSPFGGTEGRHIQANFPVQATATELLFLQHIMKKLKPENGSRMTASMRSKIRNATRRSVFTQYFRSSRNSSWKIASRFLVKPNLMTQVCHSLGRPRFLQSPGQRLQ